MCGISGFVSLDGTTNITPDTLENMNRAQSHRGPDAEGYFFDQGVGFGHRRLSIIDVATGQQPMFSADKNIVIVFNGEIYNFQAVAEVLRQKGYQFQTHSDTEVIIYAWQEWGVDCVGYLNGMFAFAIWDKAQQLFFMARDRLGEKPLHYTLVDDNAIIFGSELKVLKAHPSCSRTINKEAIEDYLTFGYIPDPKTLYTKVYKLQAGHYLLFNLASTSIEIPPQVQYWDLPWQATNKLQDQTSSEFEPNDLIERLKTATDIRMMAEVPLGAFLSGGVDSSAVVAMMSQLQNSPVNTCAIGFDVPKYNESDFAQLVADRYQTNHRLEVVDHNDFELIDEMAQMYDEPFADSSALPTYRVCAMAKKYVTVCLSGDGGDELFAGYRRYRLHNNESQMRNKLPLNLRKAVFSPLGKYYPKADWAPQFMRAKTTFQSLAMPHWKGYLNSMSKLREDERSDLYSDSFKTDLAGYSSDSVFSSLIADKHFDDPMKEAQYLDFKTWMPGDILTKVDRASMANSLEVRVPMLDHTFIEWGFSLPSNVNLKGSEGKAGLKTALEPHLPSDNLYRKKMGFSIPLSEWLKGPLKSRLELSMSRPSFINSGIFSMTAIDKKVQQHLSGRSDHGAALWTLMMLSDVLEKENQV